MVQILLNIRIREKVRVEVEVYKNRLGLKRLILDISNIILFSKN